VSPPKNPGSLLITEQPHKPANTFEIRKRCFAISTKQPSVLAEVCITKLTAMKTKQTTTATQPMGTTNPLAANYNSFIPIDNRLFFSDVYSEAINTQPAKRSNAPLNFEDYIIAIAG
jgi:hypothetical protein